MYRWVNLRLDRNFQQYGTTFTESTRNKECKRKHNKLSVNWEIQIVKKERKLVTIRRKEIKERKDCPKIWQYKRALVFFVSDFLPLPSMLKVPYSFVCFSFLLSTAVFSFLFQNASFFSSHRRISLTTAKCFVVIKRQIHALMVFTKQLGIYWSSIVLIFLVQSIF